MVTIIAAVILGTYILLGCQVIANAIKDKKS